MEQKGINYGEGLVGRVEESIWGRISNTKGFSEIPMKIYFCRNFLDCTHIYKDF